MSFSSDLRNVINIEKFYEKGNKSAGTRIRKAMQELKKLAQEVRQDVQDTKNAS